MAVASPAGTPSRYSVRVVSLIAPGSSRDHRGRPYSRRRNQSWLLLIAFLALGAIMVWILALDKSSSTETAMDCNAPGMPAPGASARSQTPPAPLGVRKPRSMLAASEPAALAATKVRVYNANDERGQAALVASKLSDLGFASAADVQVANDPVYVQQNMRCFGQIRFGPAGRAAAATLSLVTPCSELREDNRPDDTVDLALGTLFHDLTPNDDATEVLRSLRDTAPGVKPPPLDPSLLAGARHTTC